MRSFITGLASVAIVALAASSAQAISSTHTFENVLGTPPAGTLVGNDLSGLNIGDRFEVAIVLDNSTGDSFLSIFTHLIYDASVIEIVNGVADTSSFPSEGLGQNTITALGAPAPAAGEPAGTGIGIAVGVNNPGAADGLYSRVASGLVAVAVFEVVGFGSSSIAHVETGFSDIRTGSQALGFSGPLTATVIPEPGTALLMGLGLAGLASAGRRRA